MSWAGASLAAMSGRSRGRAFSARCTPAPCRTRPMRRSCRWTSGRVARVCPWWTGPCRRCMPQATCTTMPACGWRVMWCMCARCIGGQVPTGCMPTCSMVSWQWVAGTGSSKPYVFNAENVARFAPAPWHSEGSVIDTTYEALDQMARSAGVEPSSAALAPALTEPALYRQPPAWLGARSPQAADVAGREVWLVHPWQLGALPEDLPADTVVIGLWLADFHRDWPWGEARWRFAATRLAELTGLQWWGDAEAVGRALAAARGVRCVAEPHLQPWLSQSAQGLPAPRLFPRVERPCTSFSQWWTRASKGLRSAADLLSQSGA